MRLSPIILKLRLQNIKPFEQQIAGLAEFSQAVTNTLISDTAFVVQLSETATPNLLDTGINQKITETFAVIVALKNDDSQSEKTGILAHDALFEVRAGIWRAILGWEPPIEDSGKELESPIAYVGGRLLDWSSAYIWYQFEFSMEIRITSILGNEDGIESNINALDDFNTLYTDWILNNTVDENGDPKIPIREGLPVDRVSTDRVTIFDMTEDSNEGSFSRSFGFGYNILKG